MVPDGDRIELRGLRVVAAHGVLPEEIQRPQPFEVDLDLYADLAPAGETDDLLQTVDYADLCEAVADALRGPRAALLEHLAQRAADAALRVAGSRALRVTVTVRKLRPPVALDLASSAVTITRETNCPR